MDKILIHHLLIKYIEIYQKFLSNMIHKLEIHTNEKGEVTSPSYVEIVSKINEIIQKIDS